MARRTGLYLRVIRDLSVKWLDTGLSLRLSPLYRLSNSFRVLKRHLKIQAHSLGRTHI